jgi:hypothetical protein
VLAWGEGDWLYLLDGRGERQGQARTPGRLVAACGAEDGSYYAAVGKKGEVWWLTPDLIPRWERALSGPAVAVAMDPFGQYVAAADEHGQVRILDRNGGAVCELQSPRPLYHLAFVPAAPVVIGSADYGLVTSFDFKGRWLWRDGLVAHVGALSVSGNGHRIVLACFSEGLLTYSLTGQKLGRHGLAEPSRLVSVAYDGRLGLVAGLSRRVRLIDAEGQVLYTHGLERPAVAVALDALGETGVVAQAEGPLVALDLRAVTAG